MKFVVKFVDLRFCLDQSLLPDRRDLVNPSLASSDILENRLQQAAAFQAMQERVESSGANAISVMLKLLHHGQSKDWLVRSVHKHMNPYESEEEFPLLFQHKINILLLIER